MTRPIGLHPEAIAEAQAAAIWYRERSEVAASAFLLELDAAIARIGETPDRWPLYLGNTRRVLLRRFPFFVVYHVGEQQIEVLAIAHGRRKPGYWKDRRE